MESYIFENLELSLQTVKDAVGTNQKKICKAVDLIVETIHNDNKILVCGNGGSASDSLHICGEFTNRLLKERRPLPAFPLSADIASITAIANDYSFDDIFSKQVLANGRKGDILWALSTSGNSKNIINAAKTAQNIGMKVISFTGGNGGEITKHSDLSIIASATTICPRIQEAHVFLYHIIIEMVENKLFPYIRGGSIPKKSVRLKDRKGTICKYN